MVSKKVMKKIMSLIICACIISSVKVFATSGDWGISHTVPGQTPKGNETADYLKQYDAFYIGNPEKKEIYLTFDAGFENGYTPSVLDTLKKHNVPATFFLVGTYIRDNGEIVKRMVDEGHIVGNHTMTHPDMSAILNKEAFIKELSQSEEIYESLIGEKMPKCYRPPRGKYSRENMEMAQQLGYKTYFWSLAYVDWEVNNQPSKEQAFSKLIPRIHNGAILLLHNTSKTNSVILDELIQKYKALGYEFKSLNDID